MLLFSREGQQTSCFKDWHVCDACLESHGVNGVERAFVGACGYVRVSLSVAG